MHAHPAKGQPEDLGCAWCREIIADRVVAAMEDSIRQLAEDIVREICEAEIARRASQ